MNQNTYDYSRNKISSLSRALGIAAMASAVITPDLFVISAGLGFFAILMAFLSKGYGSKFNTAARLGTIFGAVAITIDAIIVSISIVVMVKYPNILKQAMETADMITGVSSEELYGKDINTLIDELFGGIANGK